jgi:hypothetical protein
MTIYRTTEDFTGEKHTHPLDLYELLALQAPKQGTVETLTFTVVALCAIIERMLDQSEESRALMEQIVEESYVTGVKYTYEPEGEDDT